MNFGLIEKVVRALINVGAELRQLSFAITMPPVPDWYQPEAKSKRPKGAKTTPAVKAWLAEYERQRILDWPLYWQATQRERLVALSTQARTLTHSLTSSGNSRTSSAASFRRYHASQGPSET